MTLEERISQRVPGNSLCPVHSEKSPSLHVSFKNGKTLLHCFGCNAPAHKIAEAIGLEMTDLFEDAMEPRSRMPSIAATERALAQAQEEWRSRMKLSLARQLRTRDDMIRAIRESGLPEEETMAELAPYYVGYSELEWNWQRLIAAHIPTAELYRELESVL